jgi:hypothetical protein
MDLDDDETETSRTEGTDGNDDSEEQVSAEGLSGDARTSGGERMQSQKNSLSERLEVSGH